MQFWFVILVVISANGNATLHSHYPKSPKYNNELDCRGYGQIVADEMQLKLGTNNHKVFWKCESVSLDTIAKSLR